MPEFWRAAAEGTSISDDPDGVRILMERDPEALLLAVDAQSARVLAPASRARPLIQAVGSA